MPLIAAGAAWEGRLQAALGNDLELLALAIEAPSVDHKLSAVQALASEDALRNAEREFRKHDRRVHSLAKQRYETLVKQRETRASATALIQAAAVLGDAPMIPANRLVELNQAWDALDIVLIDDEQKSRFAELQASLAELMRQRGERKRAVGRWSAAAKRALADLTAAGGGATIAGKAPQELAGALAAAGEQARAALAAMPDGGTPPATDDVVIAELGAAIQSALQDVAPIAARLTLLVELRECQAPPADPSGEQSGPRAAATAKAASERWQALPPVADARIGAALNARFEEWRFLQDAARKKLQQEDRLRINAKDKAVLQARIQALTETADATEAALAAGHLAEAGKLLAKLQADTANGGASAALQTRIGALQAEFSRLKGWQHWGGGRVRDDLVLEAEALAASTVVAEGARPVKLPIKQLENDIEQLRVRWKELDRLGGATSKPLWQRFETALKAAYLPVAAHLARLNEARQDNLAARKNLLLALDAVEVVADGQGKVPDWKEIARALAHFETEWRKLGPIEHTVPHKARAALMERMKAGVTRLDGPLREAQAGAEAQRRQLVVRAQALSADAQGRDLMARLRELQSQWQSHAKSQPLPRRTENQLWAEFRAATDAVMSQREAALSARDAGFKANQATREALIVRLEEIQQDTPPADIKRVLAAVDSEWRKAGEAPRNQMAKLESKYRAAREHALEHVAGSAQRSWSRCCDALVAKLALCEELESATPPADSEARWTVLPALPARWEQALQARYKSACEQPGGGHQSRGGEPLDQLLLQLESSLNIPSPEAFQIARRTLKLLAMKNAMEGRRSATSAVPDIETMTAAAFGHTHLDADQHSRLESIVGALRKSGIAGPRV